MSGLVSLLCVPVFNSGIVIFAPPAAIELSSSTFDTVSTISAKSFVPDLLLSFFGEALGAFLLPDSQAVRLGCADLG